MAYATGCAAIEQLLITESGRISPTIYRRTLNTSPWLKLIKQEPWPDEMGHTISVMTYERSLPSTAMTWANVGTEVTNASGSTLNDTGGGGSCLPPKTNLAFAQTLRTFNLQHGSMESPRICVNDLRYPVARQSQMSNIMQILTENAQYVWIDRYRDEYTRLSQHKVIAAAGLPEGSTSFPLTAPTSVLTQGILRNFYMKLIRDGAGNSPLDRENARPVFGLITSSETSDGIIKANANIRDDYRWSSKVNELLAPLGIDRSFNGFFHMNDDFSPRWNFTAGAWVRVLPYASTAATKGNKWDNNPAYETAAYTDSYIFNTEVLRSLIPAPITSAGGAKFDPVSYRGDFRWRNILDEDCNPDGTIGYFRGVFSSGSKPVFPQWGYVIRHLRCDTQFELAACS